MAQCCEITHSRCSVAAIEVRVSPGCHPLVIRGWHHYRNATLSMAEKTWCRQLATAFGSMKKNKPKTFSSCCWCFPSYLICPVHLLSFCLPIHAGVRPPGVPVCSWLECAKTYLERLTNLFILLLHACRSYICLAQSKVLFRLNARDPLTLRAFQQLTNYKRLKCDFW